MRTIFVDVIVKFLPIFVWTEDVCVQIIFSGINSSSKWRSTIQEGCAFDDRIHAIAFRETPNVSFPFRRLLLLLSHRSDWFVRGNWSRNPFDWGWGQRSRNGRGSSKLIVQTDLCARVIKE